MKLVKIVDISEGNVVAQWKRASLASERLLAQIRVAALVIVGCMTFVVVVGICRSTIVVFKYGFVIN